MADNQESQALSQSDNSPQDQGQSPDPSPGQSPDNSSAYPDEIAAALDATGYDRNAEDTGSSEETEAAPGIPAGKETVDSPKEDAAPAPRETDRVKPSALATFHRQQKDLFAREQQFKADKAELDRMMGVINNAKSDRLAAIELMGYDNVKDFLQGVAEDGGRETPERKQIRELQAWKAAQEKEREEQQKQFETQRQQHEAQSKLDAIRAEVQTTLKSEAYADGLLSLAGSDENVMAEMDRMATETGEMPRIEDAIKNVEGKYRSYLNEMLANREVTRFFEEKLRQTKSSGNGSPQSKTRAKTTTIDSGLRSPGTRVNSGEVQVSEEDTLAEAIAHLRNATR